MPNPQASLFDAPASDVPYQRSSRTSKKAAERIVKRGVYGAKMLGLLNAYAEAGERGLTGSEVQRVTGMLIQSVCSLRRNAVKRGYLVPCGERMGPHGTEQEAHRITKAGREEVMRHQNRNKQGAT